MPLFRHEKQSAVPESDIKQHTAALLEAVAHRSHDKKQVTEQRENLLRDGLVSQTRWEKGTDINEALTQMIVVGDTVLGISREVTGLHGGGKPELTRVRVAVLPVGSHAEFGSSRTLLDIDPRTLREPRQDGVIQPWERVDISRQSLTELTGVEDRSVSRDHGHISVETDGMVSIVDHGSANGTDVVNDLSFYDRSLKEQLAPFVDDLQARSEMWAADTADRRVIDPYQ